MYGGVLITFLVLWKYSCTTRHSVMMLMTELTIFFSFRRLKVNFLAVLGLISASETLHVKIEFLLLICGLLWIYRTIIYYNFACCLVWV